MTFDDLRESSRDFDGVEIDKLHPWYVEELRAMTNSQRTTVAYMMTVTRRAAEDKS